MRVYNYSEAVKNDVLEYIQNEGIKVTADNREEIEQQLNEDLWSDDSLTGNGSGSYFYNANSAADCLCRNWDLLEEALYAFGYTEDNPIERGEEWCDVTIRCYLLGQAISEALDEVEEE
jgi:hypothetical protein